MRYFIAFMLLCSIGLAGEDIFKPTGRYAEAAATTSRRYVAQFSIPSCGPCRDFERTEKPKIELAGFHVSKVDLSDANNARKYGQRITRFPTFLICDYQTGEWIGEPIVGYTSAETLLAALKDDAPESIQAEKPVPAPAQKQESFSIYSGKAGSSHQNRASLIDHLLNEGIHSGRHTSQQLNAMTDSELNYLHESDHGWSHSQPQPVVRIQQSGCVGGNCPSPTNRAQRSRGGFLRGLFRN